MSNCEDLSSIENPDDPDAWRDITECEQCGDGKTPLRAIKMKRTRRQMLCLGCFEEALSNGEVDPADPRVEA